MSKSPFDFDKIKFGVDKSTFDKAITLYEGGKVIDFIEEYGMYSATVQGGSDYHVEIDSRDFGEGGCDCYMGQNDYLCKHMVALAIYSLFRGKPIKKEDKEVITAPVCSNRLGELTDKQLSDVKVAINEAVRYIKAYTGPSRIWFAYQDSLSEGCRRLSATVSGLSVGRQTADLLVKLLLRLDTKLCTGGVDDSDGTVGEFIKSTVQVLVEFSKYDKKCLKSFESLHDRETCFGWEETLVCLLKPSN